MLALASALPVVVVDEEDSVVYMAVDNTTAHKILAMLGATTMKDTDTNHLWDAMLAQGMLAQRLFTVDVTGGAIVFKEIKK